MAGGVGAYMMFHQANDDKAIGNVVYSNNNKNDDNFIAPKKINFEDFNQLVKNLLHSSFGRDVSKGLTIVDGNQYLIDLSPDPLF